MKKEHYMGLLGIILILVSFVYYNISSVWSLVNTIMTAAGALLFLLFIFVQRKELLEFSGKRSTKYGSNAFISVMLALVIIIAVNWVSNKRNYRKDLTEAQQFSLAYQTIKVLENLEKDIKLTCFFKTGAESVMRDVLKEYAYISPRISYTFIDPDKKPQIAKEYQLAALNTTYIEYGGKTKKITSTREKDITNALIKISRESRKTVYFTEGHGEKDPENQGPEGYKFVKDRLENENYVIKKIFLAQQESFPDDCDVLVVAGPQKELFDPELNAISEYYDRGGSIIFLVDPDPNPGMIEYLAKWGVQVGNNRIIDPSPMGQIYGTGPDMPLVNRYSSHEIVGPLKGSATFYPACRSVELTTQKPGGMVGDVLGTTSGSSYGKVGFSENNFKYNEKTDKKGPLSMGVVVAKSLGKEGPDSDKILLGGKMIVFGDSDFACNRFFKSSSNGDMFLNAVNWIAEEKDLIAIRPRNLENRTVEMTAGQTKIVMYLLILLPMIVLCAGILVLLKRRNL